MTMVIRSKFLAFILYVIFFSAPYLIPSFVARFIRESDYGILLSFLGFVAGLVFSIWFGSKFQIKVGLESSKDVSKKPQSDKPKERARKRLGHIDPSSEKNEESQYQYFVDMGIPDRSLFVFRAKHGKKGKRSPTESNGDLIEFLTAKGELNRLPYIIEKNARMSVMLNREGEWAVKRKKGKVARYVEENIRRPKT